MRYRFAIRVDRDRPEHSARNVFRALRAVRPTWRMTYNWPPARSKKRGEIAYGNLTGDIEAPALAEAQLIIRVALEDAEAKWNEVAATGRYEWPEAPWDWGPVEVTEWPNLTTDVYPAPTSGS